MPIEKHAGGITITGAGIPLYRLLAMRSALHLEQACPGLRATRGPKMTTRIMREFKCKRKDIAATLDAAIKAAELTLRAETDANARRS